LPPFVAPRQSTVAVSQLKGFVLLTVQICSRTTHACKIYLRAEASA